jgi:PAS domain S-box-containing protein
MPWPAGTSGSSAALRFREALRRSAMRGVACGQGILLANRLDSSRGSGDIARGMRRATVTSLRDVVSVPDPDFERIAGLAARIAEAPMAAIALSDGDRLWFVSRRGFEAKEAAADGSPWDAVINGAEVESVTVDDALADARFSAHEMVAGPPCLRSFAGVSIMVHGQKVGCLSVASSEPGRMPEAGIADLADLAALAGTTFELKEEARIKARMAADLIKEEWRHALTLEAGRVGSWVWDLRNDEIACNDIFRRMFGLEGPDPLHVQDVMGVIARSDVDEVKAALQRAFDEGVDYNVEFRIGATGRWLVGRGRVYQRDAAGKPLIIMGVNIDVTDAREAAEQTRALLRELNHRVKNTLAMIQSLARQTLTKKPDPAQFIEAFSGRLRTLSDAHDLLSDRDWTGIGLMELTTSQVQPYLLESAEQLILDGEDIRLPPDHALGLGLIIHELASNAVKYGALSQALGRVTVSWRLLPGDERRLDFVWKETGGPRIFKPAEAGFGTRLIERSLDKVLDSSVKLTFPSDGAEARVSLPLSVGTAPRS